MREPVWQQEEAELQLKLLYCFDTSTSDNGLWLCVSKRSLKTPSPASPACHKPQSAKALPFEAPCGFCLRSTYGWSLLKQNRVTAAGVGYHWISQVPVSPGLIPGMHVRTLWQGPRLTGKTAEFSMSQVILQVALNLDCKTFGIQKKKSSQTKCIWDCVVWIPPII